MGWRCGWPGSAIRMTDRFWPKVVEHPDGCWVWTASVSKGYGSFRGDTGTTVQAHRFAYRILVGDIPAGLEIDHLCRNRLCVNPWHMEPVPHRVNVLRGLAPTAANAHKTRCNNGHNLSGDNVYRRVTLRKRECRTCRAGARRVERGWVA